MVRRNRNRRRRHKPHKPSFLFHKHKGDRAGEKQMKYSFGKKGQKAKRVAAGGKGCKPPKCHRVIDKAT